MKTTTERIEVVKESYLLSIVNNLTLNLFYRLISRISIEIKIIFYLLML